ncbi:unnamed protein product, partial [Rotaria sp. Silwood2]
NVPLAITQVTGTGGGAGGGTFATNNELANAIYRVGTTAESIPPDTPTVKPLA